MSGLPIASIDNLFTAPAYLLNFVQTINLLNQPILFFPFSAAFALEFLLQRIAGLSNAYIIKINGQSHNPRVESDRGRRWDR